MTNRNIKAILTLIWVVAILIMLACMSSCTKVEPEGPGKVVDSVAQETLNKRKIS